MPEKGKTFAGEVREETVAWSKDTYQLLKQAEQGKVKSYVQDIALAVLDCKETATSRETFIRLMNERGYGVESVRAVETDHKVTWADKENALLNGFRTIADEIAAGYADGTRIRYALDNDSEDGYRKLSKDEELDILQQEFEEFTESRFGKKQQEAAEMVNKQMEELQKVLERSGKSSIRQKAYQTEKIPEDFLEKILERARMHIAGLK